ncbi:hypothetical protein GCM10028820_05640 [Tessaracoccus terricola]
MAVGFGAGRAFTVGQDEVPSEEYDVVYECSGVPAAINTALLAVRRAGVVMQVGMLPNAPVGINLAPLVSKEVALKGSFRFNDEIDEAITLLAQRPEITSIITHVVPVTDVEKAFALARDSQASGKVVVSLWLDD